MCIQNIFRTYIVCSYQIWCVYNKMTNSYYCLRERNSTHNLEKKLLIKYFIKQKKMRYAIKTISNPIVVTVPC